MKRTPKVYIEKENEFEVKDVTSPKPVNLELLDQWVIKDHTKPRDIKVYLPVGAGTWDHSALFNRSASDQHPISAITNLQETLDTKIDAEDISLIYCGTSTEVV